MLARIALKPDHLYRENVAQCVDDLEAEVAREVVQRATRHKLRTAVLPDKRL